MDESKRKIQFENSGLQIQAIWRMYQEIEKKKQGDSPITEDSPEIPELGVLLDCLCGVDALVAHVSGEALLALVQNGILHYARALTMLLAAAPSVKSMSATVRTLHSLLVTEALATSATVNSYKCPYGLRSSPHPMISLLTHRPEAWHPLTQEVAATFAHADSRVRAIGLELLRPVLAFLLAEPQTSDMYEAARRGITRVLLSQLRPQTTSLSAPHSTGADGPLNIVALLLKLLPQSPVMSQNQMIFATELLEELSCAIRLHQPLPVRVGAGADADVTAQIAGSPFTLSPGSEETSGWSRLSAQVFTMGLELILQCATTGVAFSRLAVELEGLAHQYSSSVMNYSDINLIMLGEILDCPLAHEYPEMTSLVKGAVLVCPAEANILCLASLLKPLLQILATPTIIPVARGHSQVKARAGETLVIIQQRLMKMEFSQSQTSALPEAFLGQIGQKCMLVRDLCLKLMGNSIRKTNHGTHSTQLQGDVSGVTSRETSKVRSKRGLEANLVQWVRNVRRSLEQPARAMGRCKSSHRLSRLATALLVLAPTEVFMREVCGLILQIARLEPAKALDFLPIILYTLGKDPGPESRLVLLESLPDLATHKYCVSPILKILLTLDQCPSTRALSVRLMTRLWRQQDRCFPQLLKLLTDRGQSGDTHEILLAKAGAILDICRLKPEKHGAELLAPLSYILEVSTGPQGSAASVMLLDSLYLLCQAEVMDLLSLWTVLGSRLVQEKGGRPDVAARVCRLLSLVPEVAVETEEYQVFSDNAVCILWKYIQDGPPCVKCSAFQALASFPIDQSKVSFLPDQVTADLKRHAEMAMTEEEKSGASSGDQGQNEISVTLLVDKLYPAIPASCYTNLLKSEICKDQETLLGFEAFLGAMMRKETANLPRGVYFSSGQRKQALSAYSQAGTSVDKIPTFLQQQYDKCKKPGLRQALAAGLLFCYDPPVETSRDGHQFVVRHSKMFMQMFTNLLQEVQIKSFNWHFNSHLPGAWSKFMQRLFTAVLEGRRAQLDFQGKQGNLSVAQVTEELSLAWIWSRDAILDVIRATSSGGPDAQANSVFALAGLALCVHQFAADLDTATLESIEDRSKFMGHTNWLAVACDTVLSLVDVEHKPRAGLFGLCRQLSTLDRRPASPTCRAVARGAVSLLVPVFMASSPAKSGTDTLRQLLGDFSNTLTISPDSGSSGQSIDKGDSASGLELWNGLSLGLLLGRLFEEHFSQSTGSKGMLSVWKALSALEKECFSQEENSTECDAISNLGVSRKAGCMLGLASALCGMCNEGRTDSRVHAVSSMEKMEKVLQKTSEESKNYEINWYSVAKVAASAHASSTNVQDLISPVWHRLLDSHQKHPQKTGVSLSLGVVASTMSKLGNRQVAETMKTIVESWLADVAKEETFTETKQANLCGLMAMLGSEQICVKGNASMSPSIVSVPEVIKVINNIVLTTSDNELQGLGALVLGQLHLSLCSDPGNRSTVPPTYGYLPDTSFLRAAVDFLLEAGRESSERNQLKQISAVLKSLCSVGQCLPPLDWAGLFLPLMRVNQSETISSLCLEMAASQMKESISASTFMSSWLTPPLFNSLTLSCQAALHRCLPQVIRSISPGIIKLYMERSCPQAFTDLNFSFRRAGEGEGAGNLSPFASEINLEGQAVGDKTRRQSEKHEIPHHVVVMAVLAGLRDALAIQDPPQSVTMLLYEAAGRFYHLLPLGAPEMYSGYYVSLLQAMAECLVLVPDDILDSILAADFSDATTQLKGSFIRCYLVASGQQPISLLNVVIDAAFNVPYWNQAMGISLLANCLASMHQEKTAGQTDFYQWLIELLGHTSSISSGAWPLAEAAPALNEVIHHLMSLVACVFLVFTSPNHDDLALWGLDFHLFVKTSEKHTGTGTSCETSSSPIEYPCALFHFDVQMESMLHYMSLAVQNLITKSWEQVLSKCMDWLLAVFKLDHTGSDEKDILHGALLSLRHTQQFRQASVWTKAIQF